MRLEPLEQRRFLSVGDILPSGYATGTPPPAITETTVTQGSDTLLISGNSVERKNSEGSLDSTFGNDGAATFPFTPSAIGLDSAGDIIIVVGMSGTNLEAARLTSNGQLDTTYGSAGIATVPLTSGDTYYGADFLVNSSGDVTLFTQGYNPTLTSEYESSGGFVTIARLTSTGQLDTTYGSNGFSGIGNSGGYNLNFLPEGSAVLTDSALSFGQEHPSTAYYVDSSGNVTTLEEDDGISTNWQVDPVSGDEYYLLERYESDCSLALFTGSTQDATFGTQGGESFDEIID
jgi:uncharacterized delta-60 repeat protein